MKRRSESYLIEYYLDDFIFLGAPSTDNCLSLMNLFSDLASEISLPLDKTEDPTNCITYLGLQLDSETMEIRLPLSKITELPSVIDNHLYSIRFHWKEMKSLTGMLSFCTKALPSARVFLRRLYSSMSQAKKPHHRIRLRKRSRKICICGILF